MATSRKPDAVLVGATARRRLADRAGRSRGIGVTSRTLALLLMTALALASPAAARAGARRANTFCTWGGTPATPTGTFSIHPGLTIIPSTRPVDFVATGELGGGPGCQGTVRFVAEIAPGSTCALATFDGRVEGLPGVARFFGQGSLLVPSRLFDAHGRLVGLENANINTPANVPHASDCLTPHGFEGGWPAMFSSVIERVAN